MVTGPMRQCEAHAISSETVAAAIVMWELSGDRQVQGGDPRAGEANPTLGTGSGWQKSYWGQLGLWAQYSQVCLPHMTLGKDSLRSGLPP